MKIEGMTYEITADLNLKKIIAESREVAQAWDEFADNLERIEKKYAESQEKRRCQCRFSQNEWQSESEDKDDL